MCVGRGVKNYDTFACVNNATAPSLGVDDDRMIILDLVAEDFPIWRRTQAFFGKPFIWCMLHNFGDVRGLYGNVTHIANAVIDERKEIEEIGGKMVGTGLTMEAIEHNPVIYEVSECGGRRRCRNSIHTTYAPYATQLMNEMAWHSSPLPIVDWIESYVVRRYGVDNPLLQRAWKLLHQSVYSTNTFAKSFVEAEPMIEMQKRTSKTLFFNQILYIQKK